MVCDLLVSDGARVRTLLSKSALNLIVNEHLLRRQNHEKVLWSLMNLELFLRTFKPSGLEALSAEAA
jgi:asparagine synthase (glutamine-hydrolysing)